MSDVNTDTGVILEALNDKVDRDCNNLADSGKELISGLSMPSSTYEELTLGASMAEYTASHTGWVYINKKATVANQYIYLNNITGLLSVGGFATAAGYEVNLFIPVKKGDKFTVMYNMAGVSNYFLLVYANGEV